MKRVILTVGPQCAGKSTFCEKVVAAFPEVVLVSRDKILMRMFGKVYLSSYSGGHFAAWDELWREMDGHLGELFGRTIILDAWNGPPEDRRSIGEKLRARSVTRVEAWHFVTPLQTYLDWSFTRNPVPIKNHWSEIRRELLLSDYTEIYKRFRSIRLEKEGVFDSVRTINPLEPIPEDIFSL